MSSSNKRRYLVKKKVRTKKAAIDVALQESHDARVVCDSNIRRLKDAMNNFDQYTHAMERKEARLKRRRRATLAKLRHARDGPDRKLYKKILEPPDGRSHDRKLVKQVINTYRNDLEKCGTIMVVSAGAKRMVKRLPLAKLNGVVGLAKKLVLAQTKYTKET